MRWLGLDWDEGPPTPGYRQTERFEIYRAHAERLVAEGRAYRCRCTPETLDALREIAECPQGAVPVPGHVPRRQRAGIRAARAPAQDARRGPDGGRGRRSSARVAFDNATLDDWILVRTDGTPTYNFCVVVDDVTMKITHVIRGNDHLTQHARSRSPATTRWATRRRSSPTSR